MPDFEEEQITALNFALQAAGIECNAQQWKKLTAELAPKPQFAEGQVVHHSYLEFDVPTGDYFVVGLDIDADASQTRALTQTEVGPDWVPLSDILPLVRAVMRVRRNATSGTISASVEAVETKVMRVLRATLDALPRTIRKAAEES